MRWFHTEYILKGLFLGLMLYAALIEAAAPSPQNWQMLGYVNLGALAGLVAALVLGGLLKLREGYRVRGRLLVFALFLLLESPMLVYIGVIGGTLVGLYCALQLRPVPELTRAEIELLAAVIGSGVGVGVLFGIMRQVRHKLARIGLILLVSAGLVTLLLLLLGKLDVGEGELLKVHLQSQEVFGLQLLLSVPFFYALTFAGKDEESEVEIGCICALLGLGLGIIADGSPVLKSRAGFVYLAPVLLYFWYTMRVLPGLRVLKHSFRGLSYSRAGMHRKALQSFRRALQLDPQSKLARDGFWEVHRALDLNQLANDPQTLALVDLGLCMERAGSLLCQGKPTPDQLTESQRLLDLVLSLQPGLQPVADYWRAVAHTHAGQLDLAVAELERLLDPAHYGHDNPQRRSILLQAWQLALNLHAELRRRVGEPQLALPGRRMDAIAAVERHLAANPDDKDVWGMKRVLYADLTEAEYDLSAGEGLAAIHFDHQYVQELGLALVNDDQRWQRGGEFLRMAARGLPALGPTLFVQIAQAHQRANNLEGALHNFELAKRAGRSVGPKNLADPERQAYFATVKYLGEVALSRNDVDAGIENFHLYTESERSGIETLRTLAELYERKGDVLSALRINDMALVYNPKDPDLVERKDRYYYSVMPEQLQARLEQLRTGFDLDYCLKKAKTILDGRYDSLEWLDVAHHLVKLTLVVQPNSLVAKVLLARVLLRHGERDEAIKLLGSVYAPKPEKFASGDDEDAWYVCCQLLGDLYMEVGRADLAVPCFLEFKKSSRSGARTLFKLGQAFEQLGDLVRAKKCYENVTAYEGNPLTSDAHDALSRLRSMAQ
jgi:tetratricopeptide (TPR) repeat protein